MVERQSPEEIEPEQQKAHSANRAEPYITEDPDSSQLIKKPPQVPSLKIQQAQPQGPQGNPLSEGVSAVSTIGGVTGNFNAGDYSSNPQKKVGIKEPCIFSKNSSASTNQRNTYMINTPSAFGYTGVMFGGINQLINLSQILPVQQQLGLYQSSGHFIEDPNVKANALMFQDDMAVLQQYR